jgi:hypothetical protein
MTLAVSKLRMAQNSSQHENDAGSWEPAKSAEQQPARKARWQTTI